MEWEFEPGHTAVEFRCRHMMVTWVRGHFKNVAGTMVLDPDDPHGGFTEVDIDAKSLWTGDTARDAHLVSEDFLDADRHPRIRFRSHAVEILGPSDWRLAGDLTIRGVTKPVRLAVRYFGQWDTPYWEDGVDKGPVRRAGFCATTVIDRHDFGVSWNSPLPGEGIVVGPEVYLTIDVEALRRRS
jgi:polyisoprenoid-binding protein YceI